MTHILVLFTTLHCVLADLPRAAWCLLRVSFSPWFDVILTPQQQVYKRDMLAAIVGGAGTENPAQRASGSQVSSGPAASGTDMDARSLGFTRINTACAKFKELQVRAVS